MGFVTELDLKFFPDEAFESIHGLSSPERIAVSVRNCLRLLMMGYTVEWYELVIPEVFRAVFVERNPHFLKWMRQEFQHGFNYLLKQLQFIAPLEKNHLAQIDLYMSNCLSYFPFADPSPYESITIPQFIDQTWQGIEYKIKPIELTNGAHHETDRVFAYGLEPLFFTKAKSHLIFMGTTYPAGQGFLTQIQNNFKGFESVGKDLYRTGRNKIHTWLEQQSGAVHVCGTSLGGALSLLLAIDQGNFNLARIDALNPPGLHDAKNKSQFDHWDSLSRKPQVVVQIQGDDPVSTFGIWKSDWILLRVIPPPEKKGPNGFWDHALNYAGIKGTEITELNPLTENEARKKRNFWLFSMGRLFIYAILKFYASLIRPAYLAMIKYAQELMLLMLGVAVFLLSGFSLVVAAITFLAITGSLLNKTPTTLVRIGDPSLPRNESLDLYSQDKEQDFCFTNQEINSYFRVMRCLVKNKEFVPHNDSFLWHTQLRKKDYLQQGSTMEKAEQKIKVRLNKAKAFMIYKVLALQTKSTPSALRLAVEDIYQEYKAGKIYKFQ